MKVPFPLTRLGWATLLIPALAGCQTPVEQMDAAVGRKIAEGMSEARTYVVDPNELLKEAISKNDAEGVKKAAARGADINACTGNGQSAIKKCTSPMATALGAGRTEAALALIEAGVDVNAQNFRQETLLGFAVHYNNGKVMKALLQKGADPNRYHGITYGAPALDRLLSRAAKAKQAQAVEYLLQYGAVADWKDRYGRTAYWYAGGKLTPQEEAKLTPEMRRMRQALRAAKVNPDPKDYRGRSYAQVLKLKINHEREADVADYRSFTDQSGARENVPHRLYRVDPVDKLKKAPRARSASKLVRLYQAIKKNDVAAVKKALKEDKPELNVLLGEATEGNFDGYSTPLTLAIDEQKSEIVTVLLKAGADAMTVDQGTWSPLHSASRKGNVAIVRALLQHGADPNYGTMRDGTTPLMLAAMSRSVECFKLLLDNGANPDARERDEREDGRNVEYYLTSDQEENHKLLKQARQKRKLKRAQTIS